MNLGKYIHDLLLENETVIIPGFGAFVSVYKPAEISENEIKPPSKEISFTQQIRNNDGLLVGHVSLTKRISHFDALKLIEKERENIIYSLDKGEKVTLEKTGVLFYNSESELDFDPIADDNLLRDSFGLEAVSLNEIKETKTETVLEEKPLEQEEPDSDAQKTEVVAEEINPTAEIQANKESETVEKKEIDSPVETVSDEVFEEEIKPVPEKKPDLIESNLIAAAEEPEKEKRRGAWWYLLILIPIIIAGVFVIRNNSKKPGNSQPEEVGVLINELPAQDTGLVQRDSAESIKRELDSTIQTEVDSTKIAVSIQEPVITEEENSPVFYLVGGSFKEQENAEEFLVELKEKGFDPFHIGKRGNFYIVGIGKFKTESEAIKGRREFAEKNTGSGAWILEE